MFISKLNKALNYYDPYGQLRVNSFQTLTVLICFFLINFIYSPPYLETLIIILAFGLLGTAKIVSFYKRQQATIIFSVVTTIYAILVNMVREYNFLSVLMVGFGMGTMFLLSRKFPFMAGIAVMANLLAVVVIKFPSAGNSYVYLNFIILICFYLIICLGIMNLFPRVYYVRVWLRACFLTLDAFDEYFRISAIDGDTPLDDRKIKHFITLNSFTRNISIKDHGFRLRRMNILIMKLYMFLIAARNNVAISTETELITIANALKEICLAISESRPCTNTALTTKIKDSKQYVILEELRSSWNKLCSKI
jgi:hypothetical protein